MVQVATTSIQFLLGKDHEPYQATHKLGHEPKFSEANIMRYSQSGPEEAR